MMMSEFTIQHEAQRALGGGAADADRPGTADSYGSAHTEMTISKCRSVTSR